MKLRNKKTGEIVNAIFYAPIGQYEITVWDDENYLDPSCHNGRLGVYKSIAELNEEWEDYKPAEPLIKDEKIRKAVRAWAEANNINSKHYYETDVSFDSVEHCFTWIDTSIQFNENTGLENLEHGKKYTIAELCGEED